MSSTWRYVQNTRSHALETLLETSEQKLVRIVDWLERSTPQAIYEAFREVEQDAIRWLSAVPSQRRRKFKDVHAETVTIAAAMWYGKLAYQTMDVLERRGAVSGGGGYRVATKWAAEIACEFIDMFGISQDVLSKIIPCGAGYGDWDEMPHDLLDRLERWTYDLGYLDGNIDL